METQKSERRTFWKFVVIVICCTLVGGVFGYSSVKFEGSIADGFSAFFVFLQNWALYILSAETVIFLGLSLVFYMLSRKKASSLTDEDEELYDEADHLLNTSVNLGSIYQILAFTFFAIYLSGSAQSLGRDSLWHIGIFVVPLFANIALQSACVKLAKSMSPEKRGSVYDMKFQKEWFESCDEAERQMIGQAAYRSMRTTANVILALILVAILLGIFGLVHPFVPLSLGIVWLAQTQSYNAAATKLEKRK